MSSIKCFDLSPQVQAMQSLSGSNFFPLTEKVSYILLPVSQWKPTSWAEAIRAELICVVRACARVIYSGVDFRQRLLAWLTSEPACANSVCPNWSRLPKRDLCEGILLHIRQPWVNLGKILFPTENYKTCADFDRTARKSV